MLSLRNLQFVPFEAVSLVIPANPHFRQRRMRRGGWLWFAPGARVQCEQPQEKEEMKIKQLRSFLLMKFVALRQKKLDLDS